MFVLSILFAIQANNFVVPCLQVFVNSFDILYIAFRLFYEVFAFDEHGILAEVAVKIIHILHYHSLLLAWRIVACAGTPGRLPSVEHTLNVLFVLHNVLVVLGELLVQQGEAA
jgi:hypothetical protein